jgi:signal transduction histidine kinase
MARQTTLVLVFGMALVIFVGVCIAALMMVGASHERGTKDLLGRVATFVAIAQGAPAEARPSIYASTARSGLAVSALGEREPVALLSNLRTDRLEQQLRGELQPLGATVLAVGHAAHDSAAGAAQPWFRHRPIVVRVAFGDRTRLDIVAERGQFPVQAISQIVPALLVVGVGLTALAAWLGRRITRPLDVLARAATSLGTDVAAPPLPEHGPSEIRAVAQAFNLMQQRVRRLVEDRVQMLAAVAHDLRTPITRLRLRAELVQDPEQYAKMLTDLDEMEAMISEALAFARESMVLEQRAPIDLRLLLDDIAAELTDAGHEVRLSGDQQAQIDGRGAALKRALRNLIENAVKYGHRANVHLAGSPKQVVIAIEDCGPGIAESEFEKVFRPFYRVETSRSRETGGTGLGLTVARSVVRSHGGDITLANRAEGGLLQTVVLPA